LFFHVLVNGHFLTMPSIILSRLLPHFQSRGNGIDLLPLPPALLIPCIMKLSMVQGAKRYRVLVADFFAHRPWLGKHQMMRVGRHTATDQAGLG
jgi:hypothetical protein